MPKRISIEPHLSVEELEKRYRQSKNPVERTHYQIIWLLAKGLRSEAGWHTRERVKLPDGLHLSFIPSHSPELQPAERLWTITNEPIANQCFKNLDEVLT